MKWIMLFLLLLLLPLVSSATLSTKLTEQSNDLSSTLKLNWFNAGTHANRGQTFTVGVNGTNQTDNVVAIEIMMYTDLWYLLSSVNYSLNIYNTNDTQDIVGNAISNTNFTSAILPFKQVNSTWVAINFTSPLVLSQGETYAWTINNITTANYSGGHAQVISNSTATELYLGGTVYRENDGAGYFNEGVTLDSSFRVWTGFQENEINGTTHLYDTDNNTFIANISLGSEGDLFSASLVYQGESYNADIASLGGGDYQLTRKIDIPGITAAQELEYNWTFIVELGDTLTEKSTTSSFQNVTPTNISDTGSIMAINYSVWDEDTLVPITTTFHGSHQWYLGDGTQVKNNSINRDQAESFGFYITPVNRTFILDSVLELNIADLDHPLLDESHYSRIYDFNKVAISNVSQEVKLYLTNNTDTRDIIIEVKDEGLVPLEGYFVKIKRYYATDNEYIEIISKETDIFGQITAKMLENTVKYRFDFYNADNVLVKSTQDITLACRTTTVCIVPFVLEDTTDDYIRYDDISSYSRNLSFNNDTNIFRLTWDDNTGATDLKHRLEVIRYSFNRTGSVVVCNTTSTASDGFLTCDVGADKISYTAQAYRTADGETFRVASLTKSVGDASDVFGLEGMFWSFILLMTLIIVGSFSPVVGIALYLVGLIVLGLTDIVYVSPAIIIAQLAIGIAFIWAFRS